MQDCPGFEQLQGVQDEEQFIFFWIRPPQKTTMVHAAPGGHFGICGPLPQAVLKLEVPEDVCSSIVAGSLLLMSLA